MSLDGHGATCGRLFMRGGKMSYMDRAMKAKDPRYAQILGKLGYERSDVAEAEVVKTETPVAEDIESLRAEYKKVVGKRPYHGWDADTIMEKIIEASESE